MERPERTAASQNEKEKRPAAGRFRALIEATSAIFWITPASGEYETDQPEWSAFTGQSFEESKGQGWIDAVHPEDRARVARQWRTAVEGRNRYENEYRLRRHDGEYRYMSVRAVPVLNEDGAVREWVGVHTDVTDQWRTAAALRASREQLRLLLTSTAEAIYGIDANGRCTFANPACARILGYKSADDFLRRNMHALIHFAYPDGTPYPESECPIYQATTAGKTVHVEDEVLWRRDGTGVPVEYWSHPIRHGNTTVGAVVTFIDITERKRATESLRAVAEASQVLVGSLDYEKTLKSVANLVVPRWADWCGIELLDERERLEQVAVVHSDPSKVKLAHELRERYPTNMDAPTGAPNVVRTGRSEIYPDVPDELLRRSAEDETHYRMLRDLGLRSAIVAPLTARGHTLGVITFITAEAERSYSTEDLPFIEELARTCALAVDNARLYREAQREIEERREAEQEVERLNRDLKRRVDELQTLLDVSPVGLAVAHDPLGDRITANPAFADMLGIEPGTNASKNASAGEQLPFTVYRNGHEVAAEDLPMQTACRTGATIRGVEYEVDRNDGRRLALLEYASPLYDESGNVRGSLGAFVDITELKRAEEALKQLNETLEQRVQTRTEELQQANDQLKDEITERERAEQALERTNATLVQRNRELQEFAYVASHDLQEPLRKIYSFADLLQREYEEIVGDDGKMYIDRIQNAAARMSVLIQDLLTFSRVATKGEPFRRVDLNEIAREVLSDLEVRVEETQGNVEIANLPAIDADPTQMRQLFQNLIGNALKFHRPGVPPVIQVRGHIEDEPVRSRISKRRCRLEVQDNGIGFDEKYLDRIFSPFQRLHGRTTYAGTGMGLAICRRIVERHHGAITARSKPGKGATFIITLPAEQIREPVEGAEHS